MGPASPHLHTFSRVDVVWDGAGGVIEVPEPWHRLWGETCAEESARARARARAREKIAWPVKVELARRTVNMRGEDVGW